VSEYGGPVLLDMSAWGRLLLDRFTPDDRERYERAVRAGEVLVCEPFMLEALYSARDGADHARLSAHLGALPFAASGPRTLRLALDVQARLAQTRGISHRVKPIDLLVAVIADEHAAGVLHYDHDYDLIAEHSGLRLNSVWVADRGSVA
jgi:predicted nucleic acid-binding protein